ncbi:MAG: transcriptional regulator [Spirochaetales bacterium]|nr:transcriptional regulator [Spirochaetales bacterium]
MESLKIYDIKDIKKIAQALSGEPRLNIIELLSSGSKNLNEIASSLGMPISTATVNVQKLEEAGLLHIDFKPGIRGTQKICSLAYSEISLQIAIKPQIKKSVERISMPIGNFIQSEVTAPCGICTSIEQIGKKNDLRVFFFPERTKAQLIWFTTGHLEYHFPNPLGFDETPLSLEFSAELCSEVPYFNNRVLSDISLWINDQEIDFWRSPGDFGGKKGKLTPPWWGIHKTQYGSLVNWRINEERAICNGEKCSDITIKDLNLNRNPFISVRIGVKEEAKHNQGINIFGREFGNHPQDLELVIEKSN